MKPDIVQWHNKETDRYVKFERATGKEICQKVTEGQYKNIHVTKRKPHTRDPKPTKPIKTVVTKPKKPRKVNYLNNKDLMAEVLLSKANNPPRMTDKLAHMLVTLTTRYGRKGNWLNYTYNEDMQAYAKMMLVRTWNSFNPEKSQNPFAFYTQCISNSFIQYLNQERRQRDIRDTLLVDQGLDPSFTFQEAYSAKMKKERLASSLSDDIVDTEIEEPNDPK